MSLMLSVKLVLNPKHCGSSYRSVQEGGTMINHRYACIKAHHTLIQGLDVVFCVYSCPLVCMADKKRHPQTHSFYLDMTSFVNSTTFLYARIEIKYIKIGSCIIIHFWSLYSILVFSIASIFKRALFWIFFFPLMHTHKAEYSGTELGLSLLLDDVNP